MEQSRSHPVNMTRSAFYCNMCLKENRDLFIPQKSNICWSGYWMGDKQPLDINEDQKYLTDICYLEQINWNNLISCTYRKFPHIYNMAPTCPCALVTNCPVAPCRFDRLFPNTWDPAMDPMAAAAATWLASGFSCWGQRNKSSKLHLLLVHMFTNIKQIPHTDFVSEVRMR